MISLISPTSERDCEIDELSSEKETASLSFSVSSSSLISFLILVVKAFSFPA